MASLPIEMPEQVTHVVRHATAYVDLQRILPCTNCGMAPLPRAVAIGKLQAHGAGDALMGQELAR